MFRVSGEYLAGLVLMALLAACVHDPSPEAYGAPEVMRVSMDEREKGAVIFVCEVTSMSQLAEYGVYFAPLDDNGRVEGWERILGAKRDATHFAVRVTGLEAGKTYSWRLFLGNGRKETQSSQNYYFYSPEAIEP
jgi:hypothetical protein